MKIIEWIKDNAVISQLALAVVSGGTAGILFATGFGAIALSIFISILVCGIGILAKELWSVKNDMMVFMEMTRQTFNSMSESFTEELVSQEEGHHEDIQGVYVALSNIMGGLDDEGEEEV